MSSNPLPVHMGPYHRGPRAACAKRHTLSTQAALKHERVIYTDIAMLASADSHIVYATAWFDETTGLQGRHHPICDTPAHSTQAELQAIPDYLAAAV